MTLMCSVMAWGASVVTLGNVDGITPTALATPDFTTAINSVDPGGTIKLLSPITYSGPLAITATKNFTLDMNNKSLSYSGDKDNDMLTIGGGNSTHFYAITIMNGTITANGRTYALQLASKYITFTLENVTVEEGNTAAVNISTAQSNTPNPITVKGNTSIPSLVISYPLTLNNECSDFTISLIATAAVTKTVTIDNTEGCTFTFGSNTKIRPALTLNGGGSYAVEVGAWFSNTAWNETLASYCDNHEPSYYYVDETDLGAGKKITDQEPVSYEAQIGETQYATFATALSNVQDNETIELLQDVTLEGKLLFQGETCTLDLNGHTLAAGINAIEVEGNTNLTIQGGTITSSRSSAIEANAWQNNIPTLTLDDVTVTCGTGLKTDGNVDLSLTGTTACTVKLNTLANLSNFTLTNSAACTIYVMGRNSIYNSSYTRADCIRDNALINKLGAGNDWWQIRTGFILPDQVATYSSHISSYVLTNATVSCGSDDELDYYYLIVEEEPDVVATVSGTNYYILSEALNASSAEHPAVLSDDLTVSALSATQSHNCYLDLNGHTLTVPQVGNSGNSIINGSMHISGTGTINTGAPFYLVGSTDANATDYSVLEIGANVTVNYTGANYVLWVAPNANNTAYGVRVNLAGTVNSTVSGAYINGNIQAVSAHAPIFNISGTLDAAITGIYAAGYGIWNITGTVNGNDGFGLGIKGGQLNMTAGKIYAGGDDHRVVGYNNGMYKSGAALQIESNDAYAGAMTINITGGELESNRGYAIYEYVAKSNDPTAVQTIAIANDSTAHKLNANDPVVYPLFQGGICISQSLAAKGGFVSGGKWSLDVTANIVKGKVANPISEDPYFFEVGLPTSATAEIVNDPSKNAVLTNDDGEEYAETYSSENVGDDAEVKTSTATNQVVISQNTDVVVDNSDENNSTIVEVKKVTVDGNAQLSVKEGATLMVGAGSVLLNESTTTGGLTVEAGAALVVDGLVYGSTEDNFVIEGQEDKSGIVLFSPETEFIREDHPTATYRFTSKSFRDGSKWVYQRFGMPSFDGNVTVKSGNLEKNSYICTWDYATDDWGAWSEKIPAAGLVYTDAVPFQCYQLGSTNAKDAPITYDFIVELMGNANAPLNFKAGWNPYANSYTAPIDIKEFLTDVIANNGSNILATIYLYKDLGNDTYTWQGINLSNVGKTYRVRENGAMVKKTYDASIEPMQAFIMKLSNGDDATTDINYLNNVYNPAMGIDRPASAPARSRASYNEMQIGAYNDMYWDNISVMEGEQFSAAEDNGYDAPKYDHNRGLSLYVINGEQHMERVATDNADGLFIGINAPVAGTYTLDFSGIVGMNYSIMDMTNNTIVTIEEDGEYNFFAEAGKNDYRFQLVAPARIPTAIENTGIKTDVKGVYTITGQFVGEDINALPKGVYIINGAKVVK